MKIVRIESMPISIRLLKPFKISLGSLITKDQVVVKIRTDTGITGFGAAIAVPYITGETQKTMKSVIDHLFKKALIGENPFNIERILEKMDAIIIRNTGAKAAIDIAIHDVIAKALGLPLHNLLGGCNRTSIPTNYAIPIGKPEEAAKEAEKAIQNNYGGIKIKVGTDSQMDFERVKAVRETVGNSVRIRVDANQGWSPKEAIRTIRRMEKYDIELAEQPTPAHDIDGLAMVTRSVDVPVMADESVHTPQDAVAIIRKRAADIIGIKLEKAGGIRNASKIISIAEAAGISCIMITMGTGIQDAAGIHLMASMQKMKYTPGLGASLYLLEKDVCAGLEVKPGVIMVPHNPGLGIEMKNLWEFSN